MQTKWNVESSRISLVALCRKWVMLVAVRVKHLFIMNKCVPTAFGEKGEGGGEVP